MFLLQKLKRVEKNIDDFTDLVKITDYDAKISDIEGRYFTASDYNKFMSDILDAKIKQKALVKKSDISNLVKNSDLDKSIINISRER